MSNDDGLFREIQEEVRKEQLAKIWDKYGVLILGGLVAVLLGVSGYKLSNHWAGEEARESASVLYKAESLKEEKKTRDALTLYKRLASSGPEGYAAISRLRVGALEAAEGKMDKAIIEFSAVSANKAVDPVLRDFATIQSAMLSLDKDIPATVMTRLRAVSNGTGSWRHNAREILALAAFKAKDLKEAGRYYAQIMADPKAPENLRKRADMMSRVIDGKQDDAMKKEEKKEASGTGGDKKKK